MSLYKLHIKWKEKEIVLKARSLDMTHPYFVSIKDLVFSKESKLIINPGEDDVRREFGSSDHLMFPFQNVLLIEEIRDRPSTVIRNHPSTGSGSGDGGDVSSFPG